MLPRPACLLLCLAAAAPAAGQTPEAEPIRFARTPDVSPDGRLVAFSYAGDIWTVEAVGGIARPVTMHEDHDYHPAFSPDGRWIAFSSNRYGSYDVFTVPAYGGRPRRLTFDSADDVVQGWTPDGKGVLFTSDRSPEYPNTPALYRVPAEGGAVRRFPIPDVKQASHAPQNMARSSERGTRDGEESGSSAPGAAGSGFGGVLAYVTGPGLWYRKGYRGSSNDDVWVAAADGSFYRRVTDFDGQDTSPMWSPDGRTLFYVTEEFGTANIARRELDADFNPAGPPRPVTHHRDDAVRLARISAGGGWIVYECGGDIWLVSTAEGATPRKVLIEAYADDKENPDRFAVFTRDMTEYSLSPDEKHVAFVVHGELFRVPVTGGKAVRLTDSPAYDHGVSWSPDGKKLLFASDRGGYEDLYLLEPDDPEHPELTQAHRFKVTQITHTPEEEQAASFSPDGKRIVFLRSGRMWHAKPDGTDAQVLVDAARVIDYDWSPDGKWVVYSRMDGSFASELYILPFPNPKGEPARNVTRYATSNVDVTWSRTGHKLAFLSNRSDQTCVHVLALQKPAAPDAPRSDAIDWEDIHLRVSRPTSKPARHGAISPDGTQVAFRSTEGGDDLWLASVSGSSVQRLTTGNQRPQFIRWSKRSALGQIYYLNGSGELRIARPSGSQGQVNFRAEMVIRRGEEFLEMFDQTWRELADNFYDPAHHGTDWRAVREKYRPWVSHVRHKEDLYALISLMLGELNASHLGVSGPARSPQQATAELGLLFDERHPGPGLKVAEVLARGPADRRGLDLQPGDVVLAIDRTPLTEKVNLAELLNGKAGEAVLLEVTRNPSDPKDRRKIEIKAATRAQVQALMYDRWVARNAEAVAKLSGGRLGYIHIPAMNDSGLERFVRALYSDNFHKEGIVLDVRYNGGGFTHDQVLNYLVGRRHTVFRHRDGGEGTVLRSYDRKWTRPLTLLINNRSYSDAEIFPSAFRAWGLGRIVGQPTGGFVIGTGSASLIDGSTLRVPRTGVFRADGVNMEREGVRPDVLVVPHPAQVAAGEDPQLERAVEVLLGDVEAPKKQRPAVAGAPPAAPAPPAQNSGAGAPR